MRGVDQWLRKHCEAPRELVRHGSSEEELSGLAFVAITEEPRPNLLGAGPQATAASAASEMGRPMFEWDAANRAQIRRRHSLLSHEVEEAVNDPNALPLPATVDRHEQREPLIGITAAGRMLFVVITGRGPSLRVVTARPATIYQRRLYWQPTMSRKELIPVYSMAEIPPFAKDEECAEFWNTHEATQELAAEERARREKLGLPLRGRRRPDPGGQP